MRMRRGIAAAAVGGALLSVRWDAAAVQIAPQTEYARAFLEKCDGQQWFTDEIERLLNTRQTSIADITGSGELDFIKTIGFRDMGISGKIPRAVGELRELRYLFLSDNHLSGEIPSEVYGLQKLQNLDLSGNDYRMPIPPELGEMPSLTTLALRGNHFTGTIPETILRNGKLTLLDVSSNELTGALPAGLNDMTGLQYLAVADNPWGGNLPDLGGLHALKGLSAWNCRLGGELPGSLYTLTDLQILDLAGNALTGELAPQIGNLTDLQMLGLGSNMLEGNVPEELENLASIEKIDLSDNRLCGTLPDAFGNMTALEELHIEDNQLRGLIPDTLKARFDGGAAVHAQRNYMTGEVLKEMGRNDENFVDGADTPQYQLTAASSLQISKETDTNLYSLLQNKHLLNGNTTRKPLRPVDEYEAAVIEGDASKIELRQTDAGIFVKAKDEIPRANGVKVEIAIRDNVGSAYSKTEIALTTETVPSGGGFGGGGGTASEPKKPILHAPYINGYPDGTFRPEHEVTREELAKMLTTALGEETAETVKYTSFLDVRSTDWSAPYIERAKKLGYLKGDTDGNFRPAEPMTRAELAACLMRAAGAQETDTAASFLDVRESEWYAEAVVQAAGIGLVKGYGDGSFRPEHNVTRAEAVAMLNRMLKRDPQTAEALGEAPSPFTDMGDAHWAYLDILEASLAHEHGEETH